MGSTHDYPTEAPTIRIPTAAEFRDALLRVRKLEDVRLNSVEGLERTALEIAIATCHKDRRNTLSLQLQVGGCDG